jgi:hypothetical protein
MGLSISINDQAAFNVVIGIPGPAGQPGPQGVQGPAGTAASIAVGSVTTVTFGNPATVTNVGSTSSAIFDFGIPAGQQGIKGDKGDTGSQGQPGTPGSNGVGVPTGGTTGQVLKKSSNADYATVWGSAGGTWGTITGTLSAQTDLQSALDGKLSTSAASSTYIPFSGGYITGDLQSNNGSAYRTYNGGYNSAVLKPDYLQFVNAGVGGGTLTVEWDGITFLGGKQTIPYPGTSILNGYATESWVTTQLGSYLTTATAASTYAPIAAGQPTSGTVGQVLTKNSGTSYDASWTTIIPGDRYLTTSTTSLTVNNGTKNLTVGTGLSYSPQQDIVISYDGTTHMHAVVISYNSSTGAMVADVQQHTGSGTHASWTVNVGGTVPVQSVAWGDITGTLGSQSDLAGALNDKLDSTTAALTYYLQTNPAGYIDASALAGYATESWVSYWFYPLTGNPSGFLTDAPSDDQTYGRKNGSWVVAGGGSPFTGGDIPGPITMHGTTFDSEMSSDFFGVELSSDNSQFAELQYDRMTVAAGASIMQVAATGIIFPDSSVQTTAALTPPTNNSQLATTVNSFTSPHYLDLSDKNGIVLCQSGCGQVYLTDSGTGWNVGEQVLIVNNSGMTVNIGSAGSSTYISYNGGYLLGVNGVCAAVYVDTNLWVISGNLTN